MYTAKLNTTLLLTGTFALFFSFVTGMNVNGIANFAHDKRGVAARNAVDINTDCPGPFTVTVTTTVETIPAWCRSTLIGTTPAATITPPTVAPSVPTIPISEVPAPSYAPVTETAIAPLISSVNIPTPSGSVPAISSGTVPALSTASGSSKLVTWSSPVPQTATSAPPAATGAGSRDKVMVGSIIAGVMVNIMLAMGA